MILSKFKRRRDKSENKQEILRALFDEPWFRERYSDVPATGSAFAYFAANATTLNPNPLFAAHWYLRENPDVEAVGLGALDHYVLYGDGEGRKPSNYFDTKFYRALHPDLTAKDNALAHYLHSSEPTFPNPLFDDEWYLSRHPDAGKEGLRPLSHYILRGWRLGYDPSPAFSTTYYLLAYPEVAEAGVCPLLDYLSGGDRRGRSPSPEFDSEWYLQEYEDVAAAGENALAHYLVLGKDEGRERRCVKG